ncbi:disease resistance protein RPV1-like [Quercus robur]|uniref:disease resistance protein RPV1-like n=1 Tax=Quercus robur TaxID=38942 RepID=UPI002163BA0D|nr:disease resistance protein RPV1-like [Quercus robur]
MASMNTERASSSSSSTHQLTYEVFLSFRGEDTRNGFTSHLYTALGQKGIYTFIDDEKLERGKLISPTVMKAIKESRFAIVILSKNYASSTWCLEELEEIIGCITKTGMIVLPIFYNVDPSDVRKQIGTFKQAFDEHEQRFKENTEKVQKWKAILKEVANSPGWHLPKRSEAECIQDIVEVILNKLDNTFSAHTFSGLIGMESRVEKLKSHLAMESSDVRIIGIWGTGGMGKTTLARVVYRMVSNKFEACCFLDNVREESKKCGLCKLQKRLLKKLLMIKKLNVQDVDDGVQMIKNRLHNKKILLVLDDVTELDQLKKLAGEHCWFGSGSRIMITTRDRHLLVNHEVNEIYEAKVLNHDEALKLFSLKAFKKDHPVEDYEKLSQAFVDYSKGLPLALEVLGSFLFRKSIDIWKSEVGRLTEFGESRILNVLRISFDGLQEIVKKIFLNIACFFNQMDRDKVIEILDSLELYPGIGLEDLIDKSLIKLHWNRLWMHDLLRDMGRDIVLQECPKNPGKRSRLWLYKDIDNVLITNTGTEAIEGIVLNLRKPIEADWNPESFLMMQHLKLLIINNVRLTHDPKHLSNDLRFLDWRGYSSKSLPSSFQSNKLIELHMCYSYIERLWEGTKSFERLKLIKLNKSQNLIETPDVTKIPVLEKLFLEDCINLLRVHKSIGVHKQLTILNLKGCKNLRSLPNKFEMRSLEILILSGCSKVKKIPEFEKDMLVLNLYLDDTAITELPTSIGVLKKLTSLNLKACKSLKTLPNKFEMESLKILTLSDCSKVKQIPEFGRNMKRVCKLYLDGTAITKLPTSIEHLTDLASINLRDCKNLVCLPNTIFNLRLLKDVDISGCSKLERLPENLGNAGSIEELDVSGTAIRQVPPSIGLLHNLKQLSFRGCKGLSSSKSKSW